MDAPSGSLIVYATAPGSVAADGDGRNGIFTKNLLANLETPGLEVGQMLKKVRVGVRKETSGKQTPWESSSLEGGFYFNAGPKTASVSSTTSSSSIELERQKLAEDRRQFEAEKQLMKDRQKLAEERRKLEAERERIRKENERTKVASLPPDTFTEARRSMDRRYIDNGSGVIKDTNTGLMWTKEDSYAATGNCMDWNASKSYVSRLNTGGFSDWRLPTVKELKGVYEKSKSNKDFDGSTIHSDPIFASGGAYWYWSSDMLAPVAPVTLASAVVAFTRTFEATAAAEECVQYVADIDSFGYLNYLISAIPGLNPSGGFPLGTVQFGFLPNCDHLKYRVTRGLPLVGFFF